MTQLVWEPNARYEQGIDRGVLYPSTGDGVAWDGLVSVNTTRENADVEGLYFDGIKYLDVVARSEFKAEVTAFSAPAEFGPSVGEVSVVPGLILTRQPKERFGFSYRSQIVGLGYKLHLVYNALAVPQGKNYKTQSGSVEPVELKWTITARPEVLDDFAGSAHFIVDSTESDPAALTAVENFLYGTVSSDPALPSIAALIALFA